MLWWASSRRKSWEGLLMVTLTWVSSTTSTLVTSSTLVLVKEDSWARSSVNFTSLAVQGLPSVKVTLSGISKTKVQPSSETVQLLAMPGITSLVSGSTSTRVSWVRVKAIMLASVLEPWGSRVVMSLATPMVMVSL